MASSEYVQYSGGKPLEPFTGQQKVGTGWLQNFNTPEYAAWLEQSNAINAVPYGSKASDILAAKTRAEWEMIKRDFLPIEKDILQQLTFVNKDLLPNSINSAQQTAGAMSDTMAGVRNRSVARYGITMDPQAQEQMATSDALSKTKNMVNAGNYTRQRLLDRDKEVMLGGINAINAQ